MDRNHADESGSIDSRFSFLADSRPGKPRETGLTFVVAEGPFYAVRDADHLRGLLEYAGAWIDWYKFTVGAHVVQPPDLVAEKLRLLDENEVEAFPGGNLLEDAILAGETTACLEALRDVGFPRLEVSTTTLDVDLDEKAALIERAADMGFAVHGEVGRKAGAGRLSTDRVIEDMERCLDAGADRVIFESDAFEAAFLGDDPGAGASMNEIVDEIGATIGHEPVIFELPLIEDTAVLEAAGWLIGTVGSDVNLGNVTPSYINLIEQMRRGIGPWLATE
jgi:phosphosulfolactate synthase